MSVLAEKFGSRKVTIAGSVIACVGFLLSTQATSIEMLIVTWGVIGGMYMSFYPAVFVCVLLFWGKEWCLWMGVFKGVEIWTSEAAAIQRRCPLYHKAAKGLSTCGELFLLLRRF